MKSFRKGQAAMEFLMTYGWAILVVLIAIAALVYFGAINPERFVSDSCTLAPPLSCSQQGDFIALSEAADNVRFRVNNGAGNTINVVGIVLTEPDGNACTRVDTAASIADGSEQEIRFTCNDLTATTPAGTRFKADIEFTYNIAGGAYNQVSSGQLVLSAQ